MFKRGQLDLHQSANWSTQALWWVSSLFCINPPLLLCCAFAVIGVKGSAAGEGLPFGGAVLVVRGEEAAHSPSPGSLSKKGLHPHDYLALTATASPSRCGA